MLGPFLFVIYINGLANQAQQSLSVYLFPDDTKISKPIFNLQNCHQLQQVIRDVVTSTEESLLKLHPDKCKYMRSCQKNSQFPDFAHTLGDTGKDIANISQETGIGIMTDDMLCFNQHMNKKDQYCE